MVLFFTGTGNSGYVAKKVAEIINDNFLDLFDKIKRRDFSPVESDKPFVIAAPTYSWRIPHILEEYLEKAPLEGNSKIYFLMTCGDDIGNAEKYLKKLCAKIGKEYMGCAYFRMPENYIAMFTAPNAEQASRIIAKQTEKIDAAARVIASGKSFDKVKVDFIGKLKSGIVNTAFYALCVKSDKFYATDDCVACGKCEKLCPLSNITVADGKPVWGKNCTHCMACICKCPKEAIEYGKKSQGKNRYFIEY